VVGVLLLGVIQSLITFDGTLSSWWARIAIGVLLCLFCLMQRFLGRTQRGASLPPPGTHKPAQRSDAGAKDAAPSALIMQSHALPPFN
jgi:simple sugar transport system permease protein